MPIRDCDFLVPDSNHCHFRYVNWRGEVSCRRVGVIRFWFGETEWHKGRQWFMQGIDLDKLASRDFALKDMCDVTLVAK